MTATFAWLSRRLRPHWAMLVLSISARIAGLTLGVAMLMIAAATVFSGVTAAAIAGLVVAAVAKAALSYLEHFTGHHVAFTSLQRLREEFYRALVPLAPAATRGASAPELASRATRDIDRIEVFFAHTVPPAVASLAVPAIVLTWLGMAVDGATALAMTAMTVIALLGSALLSARVGGKGARQVSEARTAVTVHAGDDVHGADTIVAFEAEVERTRSRAARESALIRARDGVGLWEATRAIWANVMLGAGLVLVLLVAPPGLPTVIAVAAAIALWRPSGGLDEFATGLAAALTAAERVRAVVEAPPTVVDAGTERLDRVVDGLELDGVRFSYGGSAEVPVLADASLRIPAGEWSTITGVTGSGKSTIAALLGRGWDPDAGAVRIDGRDVRDLQLASLRRSVLVMTQSPVLLPATVAENLRLAAPDAAEADLLAAVRLVGLERWIADLPQGLDTHVGDRTRAVSGGQRQRLALARALLARPAVLVLDEALSELDTATLVAVRSRLAVERSGLTTVEITHRADLLAPADRVVVIDGGRIVQHGRAGELILIEGPFRGVLRRVSADLSGSRLALPEAVRHGESRKVV